MDDLLEELKRRKVIRTVVAYAAAVFVILQVADLTFEALGLPSWSYRFTVILSIVGFPVTAVSAWIFDLRSGEIQRTPEAVGGPVRRAPPALAAAVVLATLVVAGGATWLLRGGSSQAGFIDTDLIAVAPFRVSTQDASLAYLREGALDLLAAKLTGEPRVVDPRTLLSAWRERAGTLDSDLSEGEVVKLAAGLGAGRVLFGSIVGSPARLTLTASLRDVQEDRVVAETTIDGSVDSLTAMIDGLAGQLLGAQAGTSVESVTSTSIEAVRAYLEGRADYRRANFTRAADGFRRAVELDSTFATAALGFLDANSMRFTGGDPTEFERLAWTHRERLSSDDRLYLRAVIGRDYPDEQTERAQIEFLTTVVEQLPDRAEAWYQYGDHLIHFGHIAGLTDDLPRAAAAFRRSMELDPGFLNAALHLSWTYQIMDDPRWREVDVVAADADPAILMRNGSISAVNVPGFRENAPALLAELVEQAGWDDLFLVPFYSISQLRMKGTDLATVADRATVRMVALAPEGVPLGMAWAQRWDWLANLGRWPEALELAASIASTGEEGRKDADRLILEADLLWGAPVSAEVVQPAAARLAAWWRGTEARVASTDANDLRAACLLALNAARAGDAATARTIAVAVRPSDTEASQATRDTQLSRRQSCALLIDARLAETSQADPSALVALTRWLEPGPPGDVMRLTANLETARMWLDRGDFARAASHARRTSRDQNSLVLLRPLEMTEVEARDALGDTTSARALSLEIENMAAAARATSGGR